MDGIPFKGRMRKVRVRSFRFIVASSHDKGIGMARSGVKGSPDFSSRSVIDGAFHELQLLVAPPPAKVESDVDNQENKESFQDVCKSSFRIYE
ncbi:hypothetical protein Trydic_g23481 [Trypoxylus dichotomus]